MLHALYDAVLRAAIGTRWTVAPGATTLNNGSAHVDLELPNVADGIGPDGDHAQFIIDGLPVRFEAKLDDASVTLAYVENEAHSTSAPARGFRQAADTTCYYLLCLDSSRNVKAVKGKADAGVPIAPTSLCPFSIVKVVTVDVEFTIGVTNWNATGVTCTKEDTFAVVPASPTFAA
jgi:hypothetical protein